MSSSGKRILLVEDDEAHARIIARSFERAGMECELTVASSIEEASGALNAVPFDLVISDLRLPDGEGLELFTGRPRFPLLIMTSHGNEQIAVDAMRAGALDYIVKSESTMLHMPRLVERAMELWQNVVDRNVAQEKLRQSLVETTTLLKEVHHRVKNNLQVVCSLLSMQIACSPGESAGPLSDAHARVLAMSLIHEQIYQSETLADLNFGTYIEQLSSQLFHTYCVDRDRIRLSLSVEAIQLNLDHAIPCGLILNELLSNSLKHAFPGGRAGVVAISLAHGPGHSVVLDVSDNGRGLPPGFDLDGGASLGLRVVSTLVRQLRAKLSVSGKSGTAFRLTWTLNSGADHAAA